MPKNSPLGADEDSSAPWYDYVEPIEVEYEPEDKLNSDDE